MKSLLSLGAVAGLALAVVGFSPTAQSAPINPAAIQTSLGDSANPVTQVRHGGGPYWRHGGGWRGGPRHGWRGGPRWHGGPRYGWRGPGWRGGPRYGWRGGPRWGYGPGWGWGGAYWGAPLAVAPFVAAPYYGSDCGNVTVRRWINGRRVWVREYRCW